jgi:hypothetical protein
VLYRLRNKIILKKLKRVPINDNLYKKKYYIEFKDDGNEKG